MSSTQARYDADLHDNQIVAMYDTAAEAEAAAQALRAHGFPSGCMRVLAQGKVLDALAPATETPSEDHSIWTAIASLFVPHDDRTTFQSVIARGHAMLVVSPDATMDRQHLIHLLEETNPVDLDARQAEWLQAGQPLATGYTSAPETTADSPAAQEAEANYRAGRRESAPQASRVRSYIIDRDGQHVIESGAAEPEMPVRTPTETNTPL
jgi:hypothetical protein